MRQNIDKVVKKYILRVIFQLPLFVRRIIQIIESF